MSGKFRVTRDLRCTERVTEMTRGVRPHKCQAYRYWYGLGPLRPAEQLLVVYIPRLPWFCVFQSIRRTRDCRIFMGA